MSDMSISAEKSDLRAIPIKLIDRNPENPRILFRPGELEQLLESIRKYGIQVPISAYRDGKRYVLIDGERRWKCCLKLNKETIPALIQDKPNPLTNLLLMFNIHALREQWDLLTIALKLPRVIGLLEKELGRSPNDNQIATTIGMSLGVIRRCKLLIDLPEEYKEKILDELSKPKSRQKFTEDFFIEMERALKTVERAMPDVVQDKDEVRKILIDKYSSGIITNIVLFRKIAKIARAEKVSANKNRARQALEKLFSPNTYGIDAAFEDSVSSAYSERDLYSRLSSLLERLNSMKVEELDDEIITRLKELVKVATALLRMK